MLAEARRKTDNCANKPVEVTGYRRLTGERWHGRLMMMKTGKPDNLELRKSGTECHIREFLSSRFKSFPAE